MSTSATSNSMEPYHCPSGLTGSLNTFCEVELVNPDNDWWIGGIPDERKPMFVTPEVLPDTLLKTPEPEDDHPVPLSELWNAISTSHYLKISGTRDLFQELQDTLASGEALFSMPVSLPNASLSDDIACDAESDFGIKLSNDESEETSQSYSMRSKATVDSPTYPWLTKGHFLTTLLFSSLRLPFSQLQKQAILHWAKQLGTHEVLSLYTLQKCYEEVKKMVSDPTDKVISPLGNVFYINDIAKAIAKDYVNPLTCLAMQDFPEDGSNTMSQVFNGEKMLHEMPSPPAICIHRSIYYIGKLLQESSSMYFIPEHFFLAAPSVCSPIPASPTEQAPDLHVKELHALGCSATCTGAGFIVSDEMEIISTSAFKRSYEEILFHPSELACSLTESSKKYASLEPNPWHKKLGGHMVYLYH
ncbi:hypothetical protein EDC04DRAFT_2905446 [Pisolithus marmoratus]|nr:hypothetical protein EDC04DRAFT_2905446 [Pisolithus marmoratus]